MTKLVAAVRRCFNVIPYSRGVWDVLNWSAFRLATANILWAGIAQWYSDSLQVARSGDRI